MNSKRIGVFDAKTHLSEILEQVEKGQVYVISRRGRPIAELRPVAARARLVFGCDAGRIAMRPGFDAPLPDFGEYTE